MDEAHYRDELLSILRMNSAKALETLQAFDAALPEKARAIQIMVHPDQDDSGMFAVLIHLNGPDLYVLNKAISNCRYLFEARYVDGKLETEVPLFDPEIVPFQVNDVIVDTAIIWVQELWKTFGGTKAGLPASVFGEEDYGTQGIVQMSA
ncbi:DUF6389 family protein [Devosia alba]|jgi:hypothetical protein|uniref:DUF6389 family protein n=1 Tax=Devosia alba TaxID=3152360 RepID=UPI003267850B